jgi:WD40 repeat protein/serine/threonine protein kinase
MTTPNPTRERLFHAAGELRDPTQRAAFLDIACGHDPSLRAEIEDLLRHDDVAGSFLENAPAGEAGATSDLPRGRLLREEDLARPPAEGPGTVIGPYKLLQQIGEGGMGVVYLAEQQEPLRRQVALKVVKAGMDSAQVIARFEAERQALALMDHPHIAKVLDAGTTAQGRPYFVMELVKGTPITKYCDEHRLAPRQRLELFVPVCQALQHAHQKGIIHRDIKPSNVLVAPYDGRPVVKVIDFGVAKAAGQRLTERTLFTELGAVVGTLEYMSPEQAELNNQDIDTRSDIYSLGVLLYQLLTGTTPLTRERLKQVAFTEMLRLIREEEPPKPSTRLSESNQSLPSVSAQRQTEPAKLTRLVRGELDWIVMKALEKDRGRRYETANGLARDLERYLADEPVEAGPPSAGYRLRKYARKHRRLLATAAAFALLLLLAAALSTWEAVWATQAEALARSEEHKARMAAQAEADERQRAEASEAEVRLTLTDMHTSHGLMAGERDDPAQAILWFANAARLAGAGTERESANRVRVASWSRQALVPVRALAHSASWVPRVQFHPSGQYVLTQTDKGVCTLWDLAQEKPLPLPAGIGSASSAVWSADGRWLALGSPQGEVVRCSFPAAEIQQRVPFGGKIHALIFSADDRFLAIASANRVRVWDCQKEAFATQVLKHPKDIVALAFHPQGHRLVTSCDDDQARVFAVSDTAAEPLFVVDHFRVAYSHFLVGLRVAPTFLDRGRGLLTNNRGSELAWRDAESGAVIRSVPLETDWPKSSGIATVVVSPDGKYFAVAGGGGVQIWEVATGRAVSPVLRNRDFHITHSAAFSPDGRTLLTGCSEGTLRRWSVPSGQALGQPLEHPTPVVLAAYSPDGRFVATSQENGLVRLWASPADSSGPHAVPLGAMGSLAQLSPDGRFVLATGNTPESSVRRTLVTDVATGEPAGPALETEGILANAAFSPDGRQVALLESPARTRAERYNQEGNSPGWVKLWEWRSGKLIGPPLPMPSEPRGLAYSPDGQRLAVLCAAGQLLLLHPQDGRILAQWQTHDKPMKWGFYVTPGQVQFSPDGQSLVTHGSVDARLRVWDGATGKERYPALEHQGTCKSAEFSPDGRLLVTTSYDNLARIWDFATGRPVAQPLPHPDVVSVAVFSRDGTQVLTGCRDKLARLWDWRTGQLVCPPFAHDHEVHAVAFHPDPRWILTGSDDRILRVWEWRTGKPVTPRLATGGAVLSLDITPDGGHAVVGGFMDSLKIFTLGDLFLPRELDADDLCTWAELVCGRRVRDGGGVTNLTGKEWLQRWRDFRKRHPAYPKLDPAVAVAQARAAITNAVAGP